MMELPTLPNLAICRKCPSRETRTIDGRRTLTCKHDGVPVAGHATVGTCAENKLRPAPSDKPGTAFSETIVCQSGVNCSLCRQPEGGREWRRQMKKLYPTPNGVVDFPCPHGKGWNGQGNRANDGKKHFVISARQGGGDAVVLTGAIRDLHLAYPDVYATAVRDGRMDLFKHNPYVLPEAKVAGKVVSVRVTPPHYPNATGHMALEFRKRMSKALGVQVPLLSPCGDIRLTESEKTPEIEGPYWLLFAGGKHDFTVKWWPPEYYQRVIDALKGRVRFVRVGAGGWQPPLEGVADLRGQTNHRRLIRLMYHAQGGIGPISYGMHLSAAIPMPDGRVRPYVVLAGGSETPSFYQYPGHTLLHTMGALPCCAEKGCWKFKAEHRGTACADPDCVDPVSVTGDVNIARCMTLVTPERVIEAVESAKPSEPVRIEDELERWRKANARPADPRWRDRGPQMWKELHARPFAPEFNGDDTAWLDGFGRRVPCGDCRQHWRVLLSSHPPDYSSRESYYAWTVAAHNAVNRRLGKPEWTIAQARLGARA